jgi:hypothetical protein
LFELNRKRGLVKKRGCERKRGKKLLREIFKERERERDYVRVSLGKTIIQPLI